MKVETKMIILRILSGSMLLTKLYYFFGNKFDVEIKATIKGRYLFYKNLNSGKSLPKLRRDIHRLEKGLVMVPRRDVFGLAYIGDIIWLLEKGEYDNETTQWAMSVLSRYFELTKSANPSWLNARKQFFLIRDKLKPKSGSFYPKLKNNILISEQKSISRAFDCILSARRSVRNYTVQIVDNSIITAAIERAVQAPSACNRLPYRYVITNNPAQSEKIASCAGGTVGFKDKIPAIAVLVGDLSSYPYEVDRHAPYIDSSLSAMTFIYALESMGLSSVCINWHDQPSRREKIAEMVNLKPWETVVMLIGFGYASADAESPYSMKKSAGNIITYV
jgi:nitroreductase